MNSRGFSDEAAHTLERHWPAEFRFNRFVTGPTRARQRLIILNARRAELGQEWEKRVRALIDRTPTALDLAQLMADYAITPQPGTIGLDLTLAREGEGTGIVAQFRLLPAGTKLQDNWMATSSVVLGRSQLYNGSSSGDRARFKSADGWDVQEAAAEAISASPEKPFLIELSFKLVD